MFSIKKDFNAIIKNINKLTYAGNKDNLIDIVNNGRYFCDEKKEVFFKYNIDCIVYFATETHVVRSLKEPKYFFTTNVIKTFNLFKILRCYF